jgi:hypothetical protein
VEIDVDISIQPLGSPLKTPLQIVLDDRGSALVSISVSIGSMQRIVHEATYGGSLSATIPAPPGIYDCSVVISAYLAGALGPSYNTRLTINDNIVATASGSIPPGSGSEHAFANFSISVE